MSKVAIIITTTRPQRFGESVARWALELAQQRTDATYELVDLRDYPLPLFEAPRSPAYGPIETPEAKRWSAAMAAFDAYVFVTAEYNHSVSGVLKNALDHLWAEVHRKPAAFIGYGAQGGVRAVEHLRNILAELQVATSRAATYIGRSEIIGILRENKAFGDFPQLAQALTPMLDDLAWWTETLKVGRARTA